MADNERIYRRIFKILELFWTVLDCWAHGFMALSKPTELPITEDELQCMQIKNVSSTWHPRM